MPVFQFRYVDSQAASHSGQAEADDHDTLVRELRSKGAVRGDESRHEQLSTGPFCDPRTASPQLEALELTARFPS